MDNTAQNESKHKVLLTNVSSYLGEKLAIYLLNKNCKVYGVAKQKVAEELIANPNFSFLDINLSQPIPVHVDRFNLIIHLFTEQLSHETAVNKHLSTQTNNIIHTATTQNIKLILIAPLLTDTQIFDNILKNRQTHLLLLGDIYGQYSLNDQKNFSSQHDQFTKNSLSEMIQKSIAEDRIILEKEGKELVYPTYIDDATSAICKSIFEKPEKQINYIVSESAKTTLDVGYTIQNILKETASKEIKLFFAGEHPQKYDEETILHIPEHKTRPTTHLTRGLEIIYKNALENIQIENANYQKNNHQQDLHTKDEHHTRNITQRTSTKKIPGKNKIIVFALFLLIVLFVCKGAFNLVYGFKNLDSTQDLLTSGNFEKASANAKKSTNQLSSLKKSFDFISTPYKIIFPKKTGVDNTLDAAISISYAISDFADAAKILTLNITAIAKSDTKNAAPNIEDAQANLQKALFESSRSLVSAESVQKSKFMAKYIKPKIASVRKLNLLIQSTNEFTHLIGDITGSGEAKTYLILLQNNTELRPGGGFIGNFAIINFQEGRLKEIKVDDIYQIDGQLKEKIEPPKELKDKLGVTNYYLRDSNWVPDFSVNAQTARDFYKKETGQSVDGVIAIDLYFIQNILKVTGPIKLSDYNEEISAQNLFERGEYYAEIGFFPGSTQKKDFFSSLTRALITKVTNNLAGQEKDNFSLVSLAESLSSSLSQKHLMMSLDSPTLATFTKYKGWNNALPPQNFDPTNDNFETRDLLAISEANVGANKVNNELERKIDYEMTIGRDADLVAKLKITYTNKSQANTWPGGTYVNYLRLYVPLGATPFEVSNDKSTDIKDIQVTNQKNLTTLSTFVEVPIKSTREFKITYRIPKNIKLEKAPTYHIYFQKQPGTDKDELNFTFNLPNYLAIKSVNSNKIDQGKQNVTIKTDLLEDREFAINVAKK